MFTQTFIHTNTESDIPIEELGVFAATDQTDVSAYGFANVSALVEAHRAFLAESPGYVESLVAESSPHRITFVRVWETETDRNNYTTRLLANTNLYNPYKELMARFRTHYNVTTDPAPGVAPYYYP